MPRKPTHEIIQATYFRWLLFQRSGVYVADGRGNHPHDLRRHSLGTRDRAEALTNLQQLDHIKAVGAGLAEPNKAAPLGNARVLTLADGCRLYLQHVGRPPVQGGATKTTSKRYRAVFDKFQEFCRERHISTWNAISSELVGEYGQWLDEEDYAGASQYLELTTIKQLVKWLIDHGDLPVTAAIKLPLRKSSGTTTYCYRAEEVVAIVAQCRKDASSYWLADIVTALALTGLRISELANLRWSDIDMKSGTIHLRDTSRSARRTERREGPTTKSHRDRTLVIADDLRPVLLRIERNEDGFVFHGPRGGRLKPDTARNVLKRDVLPQLAGQFPAPAGERGITSGGLHSFRHFFCSWAANGNMSEQMLMAWLGHRESRMIRHYYHMRTDEARRQLAQIGSLFGPPVRQTSA